MILLFKGNCQGCLRALLSPLLLLYHIFKNIVIINLLLMLVDNLNFFLNQRNSFLSDFRLCLYLFMKHLFLILLLQIVPLILIIIPHHNQYLKFLTFQGKNNLELFRNFLRNFFLWILLFFYCMHGEVKKNHYYSTSHYFY